MCSAKKACITLQVPCLQAQLASRKGSGSAGRTAANSGQAADASRQTQALAEHGSETESDDELTAVARCRYGKLVSNAKLAHQPPDLDPELASNGQVQSQDQAVSKSRPEEQDQAADSHASAEPASPTEKASLRSDQQGSGELSAQAKAGKADEHAEMSAAAGEGRAAAQHNHCQGDVTDPAGAAATDERTPAVAANGQGLNSNNPTSAPVQPTLDVQPRSVAHKGL